MYRNTFRSDCSVEDRALLFVGFEPDFEANIHSFPYDDAAYQYTIEHNAIKAFRWLESRLEQLETFQLPYAIICRLGWLTDNKFVFARQIAAHPKLRNVPVIALSEKKPTLLQQDLFAINNVDDCYSTPVDWSKLEARIDFLNLFKANLLTERRQLKKEYFQLQIPIQKRIFDVIGATLGIVCSSIIWLPVMIAIWLESSGPIVYKSKRVGAGYHVFDFFKFRSMFVDSDQHLHQVKHLSLYYAKDGDSAVFVKIPQDPRTTRVGRFIRKYSLDELPQLINVLRGEMSLVGNRPLPLYEAELLIRDAWCARFLAPAGITGLWQVSKHKAPNISTEDRIMLDIQYSNTPHSVLNDLKISLRTFGAFVQKDDA